MNTSLRIIGLALVAFIGTTVIALAEGNAIRGMVRGSDGKAVAGVQIKIERTDTRAAAAVTTTDAKGQYGFKGLAVGTYKLTASVNKVPRSAASVQTRSDGWVKVDFDLKGIAGSGKNASQSATDRTGNQDIRSMQQSQAFHDNSGMTGH